MNPYGCSNQLRDSDDLDDWCEGLCGENPGLLRLIVDAAYEWRAADVHSSACILGKRSGSDYDALNAESRTATALRILLDRNLPKLMR